MTGVEPGQVAIVHLTGRLVDGPEAGEVFETTDVDVALDSGVYHDHRDFKPLEFRVGEGKVLPGLDEAVQGMTQGETRTVTLEPEAAYGTVDEDRVVTFSRGELDLGSGTDPEVGDVVRSERGDTGWVTEVDGAGVTVDFNHELAGERVEFEVRLLEAHATKTGQEPV